MDYRNHATKHIPSFPLKVGIPLSLEIPEPVRKTIFSDLSKCSFNKDNESNKLNGIFLQDEGDNKIIKIIDMLFYFFYESVVLFCY